MGKKLVLKAKIKQPSISNPPAARTYSLVGKDVSRIPIINIQNTIVQLKISLKEVEFYEEHGSWEERQALLIGKDESFNEGPPLAFNESSYVQAPIGECNMEHTSNNSAIVSANNSSNNFSRFKAMLKTTSASAQSTVKTNDVVPKIKQPPTNNADYRRNLIINSGVIRRISSIMTGFNGEEWPNYSNYDCWYCCHPFNTAPVGIPQKLTRTNDQMVFHLYGNFCSYNCAVRYLTPQSTDDNAMIQCEMDYQYGNDRSEQRQLLELLCNIETNNDMFAKIKPAPPRLSLIKFGGRLTIDQFRANFNQHNEYHIFRSPMVPVNYEIEEVTDITRSNTFTKKPPKTTISKDHIEKVAEGLNQQRKKIQQHKRLYLG